MISNSVKGADFRAQKTSSRANAQGWLKHIGKLGFPVHLLLIFYQIVVVAWDLMIMSILTYKELWLSVIYFIFPLSKKNLNSEVVVIVGSSRGLGRELALKLANLRSTVVCIDIQSPEQETTSHTIRASGGVASYYQCDITSKEQVDKTISTIEKEIGDITMLYHCCSLPSPRAVITNPPSVKQTIDISVTSYFYLLDSILPHMKSKRKGHIVFLTSVAAISGFTQQLALSVSQFAVQGLYESVVEELRVAKLDDVIKTTLVHIYPFIVSENLQHDSSLRVPGLFGSIRADRAADAIVDGVRKNKTEISIPKYCLFISQILKVLPRPITLMLRNFLDAGIDF